MKNKIKKFTKENKKPKKTYHHGDLKGTLIEAAKLMIKKDGIESLTMRNISKLAGVSHAAAYRHFKDKEELLAELAIDGYKELIIILDKFFLKEDKDLAKNYLEVGLDYIQFALSNAEVYRIMWGKDKVDSNKFKELKSISEQSFSLKYRIIKVVYKNCNYDEKHLNYIALSEWAQIHGFAMLLIDGVISFKDTPFADPEFLLQNFTLNDLIHKRK